MGPFLPLIDLVNLVMLVTCARVLDAAGISNQVKQAFSKSFSCMEQNKCCIFAEQTLICTDIPFYTETAYLAIEAQIRYWINFLRKKHFMFLSRISVD